mmetsp:Transcript_27442/g.47371  ORF Transcript_27442/g.47371 Transcript_27442/m.47371 type:complete len:86 (-) Transcript_27442:15-272(-)
MYTAWIKPGSRPRIVSSKLIQKSMLHPVFMKTTTGGRSKASKISNRSVPAFLWSTAKVAMSVGEPRRKAQKKYQDQEMLMMICLM